MTQIEATVTRIGTATLLFKKFVNPLHQGSRDNREVFPTAPSSVDSKSFLSDRERKQVREAGSQSPLSFYVAAGTTANNGKVVGPTWLVRRPALIEYIELK